jgi:hypothetical protein
MKRGIYFSFVPMCQIGVVLRYDRIQSFAGNVYCISLLIPGVSIVMSVS